MPKITLEEDKDVGHFNNVVFKDSLSDAVFDNSVESNFLHVIW